MAVRAEITDCPSTTQWNLPVTEPQGTDIYSVAGRFRFIQVLNILILRIQEHRVCKRFAPNRGSRYTQVPFKTNLVIHDVENST